jgi:hypothetical protein
VDMPQHLYIFVSTSSFLFYPLLPNVGLSYATSENKAPYLRITLFYLMLGNSPWS